MKRTPRTGLSAPKDRSKQIDFSLMVEPLEVRQLLSASVAKRAISTLSSVVKRTPAPVLSVTPTKKKTTSSSTVKPIAIMYPIGGVGGKGTSGVGSNLITGSDTPYGKTPTVVRSAYGLGAYGSSPVTFNGIQGDGSGQTIAIVDAYDYPTALTDVNAFSSQFGLPSLISNTTSLSNINNASGPTFTKISQTGSFTSLPAADSNGPYWSTGGSTWAMEAALDIEWAHVMAPKANIVLVEGNSTGSLDLEAAAAAYARTIPGVVAVSMSFSGNEFNGETSYDTYFTTPSGHQGGAASAGGSLISGGVTFVASAGDYGAYAKGSAVITPQYPAASPNVVAVGGTNLVTSGNSYVSETAWGAGANSYKTDNTGGGGGGGISTYESQPSYQSGVVSSYSTTKRTYPDLSILGDPATGVPIYDSWDFENPNDSSNTPWAPGYFGGTSLSAPMTAGIIAVADQGRAINGLGSLDGRNATLPNIYSISSSNYHDITSGNNGYAAAAGYDLASGRGSPILGSFINSIAAIPATGTLSGTTFRDTNADGIFNGSDSVLSGVGVYFDANNNGTLDSGELSTTSNASGVYTISGITANVTGTVRLTSAVSGYVLVSAPSATIAANATTTANVGLFPTSYTNSTANSAWTLRVNPSLSTQTQVLVNGVVTYSAPTSLFQTMSFSLTGTNDSLTVDYTNGNPVSSTITFAGASGANDSLSVIGTNNTDTFSISSTSVVLNSRAINYTNAAKVTVDPKGGTDGFIVSSGTVHIPAQTAGGGILSRTFSTLSVASGAKLLADSATATSDRTVYVLSSLGALQINASGQFDLGSNDMIVKGGSGSSTVNTLLTSGYAAGAWTGNGIASATAAADANKKTALGFAVNGSTYTTFDNVSVGSTDVLIKHTYYGDANLDGTVDFNDFLALQANFGATTTGFGTGNFNYDAQTDFNDFLQLQANFGLVI